MPKNWDEESQIRLLLTIIELSDSRPTWLKVAQTMGPEYTMESVRWVLKLFILKNLTIHLLILTPWLSFIFYIKAHTKQNLGSNTLLFERRAMLLLERFQQNAAIARPKSRMRLTIRRSSRAKDFALNRAELCRPICRTPPHLKQVRMKLEWSLRRR